MTFREPRGIPISAVRAFEAAMKSAGKSVDVKIYDGADQGFENDTLPGNYKAGPAMDAWSRTLAFLAKTLK